MQANRFAHPLRDEERTALRQRYRQTKDADERTHCQIVLLSADGHTVQQIAQLTYLSEDAVLYWLDRYEQGGLRGLEVLPKSGRPPKSEPAS
jgi:transposase